MKYPTPELIVGYRYGRKISIKYDFEIHGFEIRKYMHWKTIACH